MLTLVLVVKSYFFMNIFIRNLNFVLFVGSELELAFRFFSSYMHMWFSFCAYESALKNAYNVQ